jgi:cytochrome c5
MKHILKWIGLALGALVLVIIIAAVGVYVASNRRMTTPYDVPPVTIVVPSGPKAVAEGKRLFTSRGCGGCHGTTLAGETFLDEPPIGRFTGGNLTTGKGGVGARYTDGDLARAIREGIGADGHALLFMPSGDFHALSDDETGLLIAYIRSAPPVDRETPPQRVGPVARVLYLSGKFPVLVTAERIDHKAARAATPPVGATVEYGKYLVNLCTECHGAGLSGGPIPGGPPAWPPAMNLTPDPDTGLGKWSAADFDKAMRTGVTPSGAKLRAPMPWDEFASMTDTELQALWAYLRTVPPKPMGQR